MDVEREILKMAKQYFALMDEDIDDGFLKLLIKSIIDEYKNLRNYPASWTDEEIEADAERYFERRKSNIAMVVIPEVYGKMGAEGLAMLTDAGTNRYFQTQKYFNDVVPFCEIV